MRIRVLLSIGAASIRATSSLGKRFGLTVRLLAELVFSPFNTDMDLGLKDVRVLVTGEVSKCVAEIRTSHFTPD